MIFVRHGRPIAQDAVPQHDWPLDPRQYRQVLALRRALPDLPIVCSCMRRAIETARMLGPFIIDDRLAEVERPWSTTADVPPNLDEQHASALSFADSLARYLHGNAVEGWEPQNAARARLRAAVNEHGNVIYITHGTLLTLFLSPYLGSTRPMQFWAELASPDVWQLEGSKLTRLREIKVTP